MNELRAKTPNVDFPKQSSKFVKVSALVLSRCPYKKKAVKNKPIMY